MYIYFFDEINVRLSVSLEFCDFVKRKETSSRTGLWWYYCHFFKNGIVTFTIRWDEICFRGDQQFILLSFTEPQRASKILRNCLCILTIKFQRNTAIQRPYKRQSIVGRHYIQILLEAGLVVWHKLCTGSMNEHFGKISCPYMLAHKLLLRRFPLIVETHMRMSCLA